MRARPWPPCSQGAPVPPWRQADRTFVPGRIRPQVSPVPDLDDVDDEMWNFSHCQDLHEILDFAAMLTRVNVLGDDGIGLMHLSCGKDVTFGWRAEGGLWWVD